MYAIYLLDNNQELWTIGEDFFRYGILGLGDKVLESKQFTKIDFRVEIKIIEFAV